MCWPHRAAVPVPVAPSCSRWTVPWTTLHLHSSLHGLSPCYSSPPLDTPGPFILFFVTVLPLSLSAFISCSILFLSLFPPLPFFILFYLFLFFWGSPHKKRWLALHHAEDKWHLLLLQQVSSLWQTLKHFGLFPSWLIVFLLPVISHYSSTFCLQDQKCSHFFVCRLAAALHRVFISRWRVGVGVPVEGKRSQGQA